MSCCYWPPTLTGSVFGESSGRNHFSPRPGPHLTPGVLGESAGGSKSVSFEAWKQIQPICTAAPAGSCVKSTGSSCRARRKVAPFIFTQHRVVVGSAFLGGEILIAFPSPPFSLMARHVVKLSRASVGNPEDRLLVERSCSSLRFLLLSQMEILPGMGQKALWLNPLSHGACRGLNFFRTCCLKISPSSLAGRGAGRPNTVCGKKPSKREYFEPGLPLALYFAEGTGYLSFGFAVHCSQLPSDGYCQQTLLGRVVPTETKELIRKE